MLPEMPTRQKSDSHFPLSGFGLNVSVAVTGSKVVLILKSHQIAIGGCNGTVGEREGHEDPDKTGQGANNVDEEQGQ